MRHHLSLLALAMLLNACCGCPEAPHPRSDQPSRLVENVVHLIKNECWEETYDLLSARTRDENSYVKWRVGAPGLTLPESDIKVRDMIVNGQTIGIVPIDEDAEGNPIKEPFEYFWLLEDKIPGGAERCRLFNILLVKETENKTLWRVGLQEQIDRNIPFCAE